MFICRTKKMDFRKKNRKKIKKNMKNFAINKNIYIFVADF